MNRIARVFVLFGLLILNLAQVTLPAFAQSAGTPQVILLTADGALTPVMVNYIDRGLTTAESRGGWS